MAWLVFLKRLISGTAVVNFSYFTLAHYKHYYLMDYLSHISLMRFLNMNFSESMNPFPAVFNSWSSDLQLMEWSTTDGVIDSWSSDRQLMEWSTADQVIDSWWSDRQLIKWSTVDGVIDSLWSEWHLIWTGFLTSCWYILLFTNTTSRWVWRLYNCVYVVMFSTDLVASDVRRITWTTHIIYMWSNMYISIVLGCSSHTHYA